MVLPARLGVGHTPAVLTEVPQARDVTAEEGRKLAPTVLSVTFVPQLVVQHVRFHLDLGDGSRVRLGRGGVGAN